MSEFNGKKFYGFSLHNDPTLTTTTRNFEFRYTRPEQLDRAIQRVHQNNDSGCKIRRSERDVNTAYHSRDIDVDTHMSRKESRIRDLSSNEVEQLINKAKSTLAVDDRMCGGEELVTRQTQTLEEEEEEEEYFIRQEKFPQGEISVEEFRQQQPKWVEILEAPCTASCIAADVKEPHQNRPVSPRPVSPRPLTPQTNKAKVNTESYQQHGESMAAGFMGVQGCATQIMGSTMPNDLSTLDFYVEESDLEYEMMGRANYTKHCGPRPREDELVNVSNDNVPQFIEIEHQTSSMNLSFLRNASPIRYTDFTDETQDVYQNSMKIYIKNIEQHDQNDCKVDAKEHSKDSKKKFKTKHIHSPEKLPSASPHTKYSKFCPSTPTSQRLRAVKNHITQRTLHNNSQRLMKNIFVTKSIEDLKSEKMAIFSKMARTQKLITELLDKLRMSLLELNMPETPTEKSKRQKNSLEFSVRFSRNYLYPLKGMVDHLKQTPLEQLNSASSNDACNRVATIYNLIHQSLQTYSKQIRFFLHDQVPQKLSTLIELLHQVTNICLNKSIFDQNDVNIECMQERCSKFLDFLETMNDRRFLTASDNYRKLNYEKSHSNYDLKMFMNDLNMYEPKLVPRHMKSKRQRQKNVCTISSSASIVSTNRRDGKIKRTARTKKSPIPTGIEASSDMILTKTADDAITTQIEAIETVGSSELFNRNLNQSSSSSKDNMLEANITPLKKAIMEALQTVTKEQVRQVLEPILETIGTTIPKKLSLQKNSETIETVLSAFNIKPISSAQVENRISRSKVVGGKINTVNGDASAHSIQNATKALKAAKQTEKLTERRAALKAANRNAAEDDDDDDDNNGGNNNNNNKTNKPNKNKFNRINKSNIEEYDETQAGTGRDLKDYNASGEESISSNDESSESDLEIAVENLKTIFSSKNQQQSQQQQQLIPAAESSRPTLQQKQQIPKKPQHQQSISTHKPLPSTARNTSARTISASSREALLRPPPLPNKSKVLKKRRNPMLPPPRPHAGTPSVSTRSRVATNEEEKTLATPQPYNSVYESETAAVEELPHAMTQQSSPHLTKMTSQQDVAAKVPLTHSFGNTDSADVSHSLQNTNFDGLLNRSALQKEIGQALNLDVSAMLLNPLTLNTNNTPYEMELLQAQKKLHRELFQLEQIKQLKDQQFKTQHNNQKLDPQQMLELETVSQQHHISEDNNLSQKNPSKAINSDCHSTNPISGSKPDLKLDQFISERNKFLGLCGKNRFYSNPNYSEPWNVFSRISDRLANEVVNMVEQDFSTGVSQFVQDFLEMETQTF